MLKSTPNKKLKVTTAPKRKIATKKSITKRSKMTQKSLSRSSTTPSSTTLSTTSITKSMPQQPVLQQKRFNSQYSNNQQDIGQILMRNLPVALAAYSALWIGGAVLTTAATHFNIIDSSTIISTFQQYSLGDAMIKEIDELVETIPPFNSMVQDDPVLKRDITAGIVMNECLEPLRFLAGGTVTVKYAAASADKRMDDLKKMGV